MHSQTISLFRFLMLGILSKRLLVLLAIMVLGAVLSGSFINELAIINGAAIQTAFVADFLRYSLALLTLLMITTSVAEDYESPSVRTFADDAVGALAIYRRADSGDRLPVFFTELTGGITGFTVRLMPRSGSTGRRHYGWNCFCSEYWDYWQS